jgi:hypothetical protein
MPGRLGPRVLRLLGHFPAAYENIARLHHLYGDLSWLLGQEEAAD